MLLIVFTNPIKCQSRRYLALVLKYQVKKKKKKRKSILCTFVSLALLHNSFLLVTGMFFLHEKCEEKRHTFACLLMKSRMRNILGDPGADSGDEEKSKRAKKYMARRKVKNGEKSPWGQCFTRPVPNGRRRSGC